VRIGQRFRAPGQKRRGEGEGQAAHALFYAHTAARIPD
jgi:hypothetical protein